MFFDSTQVEDSSFVWPDKTEIQFIVVKAEYGPNSNGSCHILKVTAKDLNGKAGQYFDRFVVKHVDKDKEKQGHQILKKFCNAINKPKLNNPQEIVGCKFTGVLGIQEWQGEQQNYIKGYKPAKIQGIGQMTQNLGHAPAQQQPLKTPNQQQHRQDPNTWRRESLQELSHNDPRWSNNDPKANGIPGYTPPPPQPPEPTFGGPESMSLDDVPF